MKITDLMIGDWVQNETGSIVGRVVNLDAYNNRVEFGAHTIDADYVYPVPLSDNILEENKFYKPERLHWDEFDRRYSTHHDAPLISVKLEYDDGRDIGRRVEFVHELQHLLKLIGSTEEIKL